MSSGFGLNGNVGRCFYHFQDFMTCIKTDDDPMGNCRLLRDDYLECLHHRKEKNRRMAILNEEKRQIAAAKHALEHPGGDSHGGHH